MNTKRGAMRLDRTRGKLPTHGISRVENSGVLVPVRQVSLALGLRCSTCLAPTPQDLRGDKSGTDCQRRTVSCQPNTVYFYKLKTKHSTTYTACTSWLVYTLRLIQPQFAQLSLYTNNLQLQLQDYLGDSFP